MVSYWLFIINNTDEEFDERIKNKSWPIFNRTRYRKDIRPGDVVIFYKAGSIGQRFIGKAEIGSEVEKSGSIDYSVQLKNTQVWKKSVKIRNILHELAFIRNPSVWGFHLQGGIARITERDHDLIVLKSK